MKSKVTFSVSILMVLALVLVPTITAFAHIGGPIHPKPKATMLVTITSKKAWHYDGSEFPKARLFDAWVFPCGATSFHDADYYRAPFMADDVKVVEDFRIGAVLYRWYEFKFPYFFRGFPHLKWGYVHGSCQGGPVPLVDMYVAYSETPFFGETNTIILMSAFGPPSKDRVAFWAGVAPDALPEYTFPCWDTVYDDGTDKGFYSCDAFLKSVGERRAWLRNDPQGPDTDLMPKIEKYLGTLDALGILP